MMMIRLLLAGMLALATLASARAQDAAATVDAALAAYEDKDYARCAGTLESLQHQAAVLPQGIELLYVECLSADGRTDEALAYLHDELPKGRIKLDDLRHKDRPGLNRLRATAGWAPMLAGAEKRDADHLAKLDQPLRKELLARMEKDQAVRRKAIDKGEDDKVWQQVEAVDRDNTSWLKAIISSKGWPTESMVGEDGAQAAFLIAQHASFDPAFQEQVLAALKIAVEQHEAEQGNLALLTDRVLRAQGKPQVYGTQFSNNDDGSMSMQPTEDRAGLNGRRASMGLPSIEEYKRILSETYRRPVK